MPALNRIVKVTSGNCGTSVTKEYLSQHKPRCSSGTLCCPKCRNFSTKSRDDLNHRFAKNHSAAGPKNNHTCKKWSIEFPSFYSLRQHTQRYHTPPTTSSGRQVEMQSLADTGDEKILKEKIQSCRHFLVDS